MKKVIFFSLVCILPALSGCSEGLRGDAALKQLGSLKGRPVIKMKTSMGMMTIELWNDIAPKTVENFTGLAFGGKEWTDPKTGEKVKRPFYDGLTFHRVIDNFMIQGGDPLGTGTGGPGYSFEDETYDTTGTKEIKGYMTSPEVADQLFQQIIQPYLQQNRSPDKELIAILMKCNEARSPAPLLKYPVEYYLKKTGNPGPFRERGKLKATVDYGTICMANSGPNTNGSQFFIVTKKDGCPWLNGRHTVFGKVIEGMDVAEKIQKVKKLQGDKPETPVTIEYISLAEQKK